MTCLKSPKSSECLFHNILANIQLILKNREKNKKIKKPSIGFEAMEHLCNRMCKDNCQKHLKASVDVCTLQMDKDRSK